MKTLPRRDFLRRATAGAALAELRALCERELAARGGPLPPPEQRGDRRSQNKRKAGAREP